MKSNNLIVFMIILFINSNLFTTNDNEFVIDSGDKSITNGFDLKMISSEEEKYVNNITKEKRAALRKEMNYWYDQCMEHNVTNDDMSLKAKVALFVKNKELEDENKVLKNELMNSFPAIYGLNNYEILSLESKRRMELEQIKDQMLFDQEKNKKNPEIERLKDRLKELDKDHRILNDLCEKLGYIPSKIDEPLSYVEKRKIELEREYYSMQIDSLEKTVAEKNEIIEKQKIRAKEKAAIIKAKGGALLKKFKE